MIISGVLMIKKQIKHQDRPVDTLGRLHFHFGESHVQIYVYNHERGLLLSFICPLKIEDKGV